MGITFNLTLLEPLSTELARVFLSADLERIMLKTTGKALFQFWVGAGKPLKETAFDLLQATEREGVTRIVLAEMLARRPEDAKLGAIIDLACPEARLALPATSQQVSILITGLDAVRARLADPVLRDRLKQSVVKLRQIAESINSLHAYKALHECLHQLQVKQFRALKDAAKNLPSQPDQAAELLTYRFQLRNACLFAGQTVSELPDFPVLRATETMWIETLDAAGEQFHGAIENGNAAGAKAALRKIRSIMITEPPRLNKLIFVTATTLPLEDLVKTLGEFAGVDAPDIATALASLRVINATLRAEVVEHREWQDADMRISEIDQLLEHESPDQLEEFVTNWLELKAIVQDLAAREPEAKWAHSIGAYINNVDDGLATEDPAGPYRFAFDFFRGEAQYRFLWVDSKLKADCFALVRIGTPLQRILEELDP